MKILILGMGVIGTTYGYLLKKSGNEVHHLVRHENNSFLPCSLQIDILDGRHNKKGIQYEDNYEVIYCQKPDTYDFILISVSKGKIKEAIECIKEHKIEGTVLLFCNFWYTQDEITNMLSSYPYIIGFPTAGGALKDNVLECVVFDHIMLEQEEKASIQNYKKLETLFQNADISIEKPYDMTEWIWLHMAINAGVTTSALEKGKRIDPYDMANNLMNDAAKLQETVLTIRETSHIVEKRGIDLSNYKGELFPYKIPSKLAGIIMKKMFKQNELTRRIMLLHNDVSDILYGVRSVYSTGMDLDVKAHRFYTKAEEAFRIENKKNI